MPAPEFAWVSADPADPDDLMTCRSVPGYLCVAEQMDMRQCIRLCADCADVCVATWRIGSRRTGGDRNLIRTLLAACIEACENCAEECARHANAHCARCAQMCRECAEACRSALTVLNAEVHAEG